MRLIRILNVKHYDPRKKRFTSVAFKPSTNGGISVFNKECVLEQKRTICSHIREYYPPPTSNDPPVFWEFEEQILPDECELEQQTSKSGDCCHYNINKLSDKKARKLFVNRQKEHQLSEFKICENGESRTVVLEDFVHKENKT